MVASATVTRVAVRVTSWLAAAGKNVRPYGSGHTDKVLFGEGDAWCHMIAFRNNSRPYMTLTMGV